VYCTIGLLVVVLLWLVGLPKISSLIINFWNQLKLLPEKDSQLLVEFLKVAISFVGTIATVVAGVAVYFNIRIAQRNANLTEKKLEDERYYNRSRLITDRFSQAVEHLGHTETEVRLGGIYALEQIVKDSFALEEVVKIAKDSKDYHWATIEILTSFVRSKSSEQMVGSNANFVGSDIQAALTVIGRRKQELDPEDRFIDLYETSLQGIKLYKLNLCKANLYKANLSLSRLKKVNLSEANLKEANMLGAYLKEINFSKAKLNKATLSSKSQKTTIYQANFDSANLTGATLENINLYKANLVGATLCEALLSHADLREARLENANLSEANLSDAKLAEAVLKGVDLSNANLTRCNLKESQIIEANLIAVNLTEANLTKADLSNTDLSSSNLSNADLSDANLTDTILEGAIFYNTVMPDGSVRSI
jgi:uncharacterized protein YjbI with pentapeptide repeats